jgi:hypothetical protein
MSLGDEYFNNRYQEQAASYGIKTSASKKKGKIEWNFNENEESQYNSADLNSVNNISCPS